MAYKQLPNRQGPDKISAYLATKSPDSLPTNRSAAGVRLDSAIKVPIVGAVNCASEIAYANRATPPRPPHPLQLHLSKDLLPDAVNDGAESIRELLRTRVGRQLCG